MNDENPSLEQTLELIEARNLSEDDLLIALAERIAEMLEYEPDLLFSTMYRLDVSERKLNIALNEGGPDIDIKLASLVLDRQKAKMETKKKYGAQKMEDPDLSI